MKIEIQEIYFILLSVFGSYTLAGFFNTLLEEPRFSKPVMYSVYFFNVIWSLLLHYTMNIPIVLVLGNLGMFAFITCFYKDSIKSKIFTILAVYMILSSIEVVVSLLIGFVHLSMVEASPLNKPSAMILMKMITFIVMIFFKNYYRMKSMKTLPIRYWVCFCIVPISSMIFLIFIYSSSGGNINGVVICTIFIMLMNLAVFYIYSILAEAFEQEMKQQLLQQQNKYYNRQLELMKDSILNANSITHDLKNHLIVIESYIKKRELESAVSYIKDILSHTRVEDCYVDSGNIVIDSILNFKLQLSEKYEIEPMVEVIVPNEINIEPFDLTTIIGNLLDNAITGTKSVMEGSRWIHVKIQYNRGRLLICVKNSYTGALNRVGNDFISTKIDGQKHGFGIKNVKTAVEKYDGNISFTTKDDIFSVNAILFCKQKF